MLGALACTLTTNLDDLAAGNAATAGEAGGGSVTTVSPESGAATDASTSPDTSSTLDAGSTCGDGVIDPSEECDPGATPSALCVSCKVVCNGPSEHLEPKSHHCYRFDSSVQPERWNDARATCAAWGGDLAAVTSAAEYTFILSFVIKNTWLGASDLAVEGTYTWTTQEPFSFMTWDPGYPMDTTHALNCVAIGSGLGWQDRTCGSTNFPLCERAPVGSR